ncbi:MAG: thylakoid membrane photosystem I accumulation factor [Xenococcus sp. (in: cyanobacteria)]
MRVKLSKRHSFIQRILIICLVFLSFMACISPAFASIDDDRLDGNIFVVYAGNGSLVPSKITLKDSLNRERPAIIVYYADDSRDCKQYAIVVSRLQEFYGRAATIIPVSIDSIPWKDTYDKNEVGYYYNQKAIPQTVILDQQGKIVFDDYGQVAYERMDDVLRKVFDLLPRSESVELKRRSFNEFNSEITN